MTPHPQAHDTQTPLADSATPASEEVARRGLVRILRHRDFRLLFFGQMISTSGTQIQIIVVAWQVYQLTNSAVALGLIGLFQAIPRIIFSLAGGVLADTLDRRRLLVVIDSILACLSGVLALTTIFHVISVPIIYAIVLLAATVSAVEFPTRQAMVPTLVPREELADALSYSIAMTQMTSILGAAAGGLVLANLGIANSYWLDVISYLFVIGALVVMRVPPIPAGMRAKPGMHGLLEGMRFLRAHPIILAVLSLDFFATFFGSPRALLPIYAGSILRAGPQGLGVLTAATSVGALAIAPLTRLFSRIARQGLGVASAIIVWGVCIILFGFSTGPLWLSALFLAGAGAADMVSMLLRNLIVQMTTPDELRGRISSVNAMFVIGGPSLGQVESGIVAGIFTPVASVVSGGAACIVATVAVMMLVPNLVRTRAK